MPITKIVIENFKGIGSKVEIPFRPITLLFGANSAGKSTILQAMLYVKELLEGRNVDADRLSTSGALLDLGGFGQFVHGRDLNKPIRIEMEFTVDADGLEPYSPFEGDPTTSQMSDARSMIGPIGTASVCIEVKWSHEYFRPFVTEYEVGLNGEHFASIKAETARQAFLTDIELQHPILKEQQGDDDEDQFYPNLISQGLKTLFEGAQYIGPRSLTGTGIAVGTSVIPNWGHPLPVYLGDSYDEAETLNMPNLVLILSQLMVRTGEHLLRELREIRYIGPIRRIPERNFQAQRSQSHDRWADGSGAWDLICNSGTGDDWLDTKAIRKLGLGLELEQYRYFEVPVASRLGVLINVIRASNGNLNREGDTEEGIVASEILGLGERVRLQLVSGSTGLALQPCEVGVGVSQVLPVALGAMAPGYSVLAVEQPELHIHPAIQCNLGDLLAAQVIGGQDRVILLETHSEHLILRLLRRIRENTEGELPPDAPAISPDHLSVLWVEQDNGVVRIEPIPVNAQGDFDGKWPKGFFEERANELF